MTASTPAPTPLKPGQNLCVHCAYALMIPATLVRLHPAPGMAGVPPELPPFPGPGMVQAVRQAHDDGFVVEINNDAYCGVYADLQFDGYSVCLSHLWVAVEHIRNPRGSHW